MSTEKHYSEDSRKDHKSKKGITYNPWDKGPPLIIGSFFSRALVISYVNLVHKII